MRSAFVLEGNGGETVAPRVGAGECFRPQLVRRRIGMQLSFLARLHIDGVDALAVRRIGEANGQLHRVLLGHPQALGQRLVPSFRLEDAELEVAIDEHVIGDERPGAPSVPFDAPRRDVVLAQHLAPLGHTPSRRAQRRVDVLSTSLGFIHREPTGCRRTLRGAMISLGRRARRAFVGRWKRAFEFRCVGCQVAWQAAPASSKEAAKYKTRRDGLD